MQGEISGLRLLTEHNLHQLLALARRIRAAIVAGRLAELRAELAAGTAGARAEPA
jgi:tRNA-guanine family transglycosylase